jgi:hypothetical protein
VRYEKELEALKYIDQLDAELISHKEDRELYSKKQIEELRKEYPKIPDEYLDLDFNLQICQRCCINNTFGIFRILSNIEFHNIININKLI